ncbi:dTDP-4-dehydrorhamnose reductase [Ramlibacter sp. AN1015]|uniref:dTDP-4-dehydrorhamnose reductase n=1 Tax=Ramlibacter sp. AN1015 TaxID=3133428 RepID=UPI0030BE5AA0
MKILLFGKNGQLGWELQRSLAPLGELVALGSGDAGGSGYATDFREPERLADTVRRIAPDVVVNAAAYTAVDQAESDADTARRVNALAPGVLAESARAVGAMMVHYSSDYVFDGSGSGPRHEADATGPLNVYGQTKLDGERAVAAGCARHLILRTSWVYAARGGNFVRKVLQLAQERERLTVVDDQVGAPTGADLLADITAHAVRALAADAGKAGLYHAAAAGQTSWNGYARFVLAQAHALGMRLRVAPECVDAVPTSAFATAARRPANSRLDSTRLVTTFGLAMPDWRVGVARVVREMIPGESLGAPAA